MPTGGQRADDPTRFALALDAEWHDVYVKLKGYVHLDYTRRVNEVFHEFILQLKNGGWAGTDYVTLHMPTSEGHATQHHDWMRATFPSSILARAFYYASFNAEFISRSRTQKMIIFRVSIQIQDFTPETAKLVFSSEAQGSLEQMINYPTPALPTGEAAQPQDAPQYDDETLEM